MRANTPTDDREVSFPDRPEVQTRRILHGVACDYDQCRQVVASIYYRETANVCTSGPGKNSQNRQQRVYSLAVPANPFCRVAGTGAKAEGFKLPALASVDYREAAAAQAEEEKNLATIASSNETRQTFVDVGVRRLLLENAFVKGQEAELNRLLEKMFELRIQVPAEGAQSPALRYSMLHTAKQINRVRLATPEPVEQLQAVLVKHCTCDPRPWAAFSGENRLTPSEVFEKMQNEGTGDGNKVRLCFRYGKLAGKFITWQQLRELPPRTISAFAPDELGYVDVILTLYDKILAATGRRKEELQDKLADASIEFATILICMTFTRFREWSSNDTPGNFIQASTWLAIIEKTFAPEGGLTMSKEQLQVFQDAGEQIQNDMTALRVASSCLNDLLEESLQNRGQQTKWTAHNNLVLLETVAALQDNEFQQAAVQMMAANFCLLEMLTPRQMGMWTAAYCRLTKQIFTIGKILDIGRSLTSPVDYWTLLHALQAVVQQSAGVQAAEQSTFPELPTDLFDVLEETSV